MLSRLTATEDTTKSPVAGDQMVEPSVWFRAKMRPSPEPIKTWKNENLSGVKLGIGCCLLFCSFVKHSCQINCPIFPISSPYSFLSFPLFPFYYSCLPLPTCTQLLSFFFHFVSVFSPVPLPFCSVRSFLHLSLLCHTACPFLPSFILSPLPSCHAFCSSFLLSFLSFPSNSFPSFLPISTYMYSTTLLFLS